MFVRSQVRYNCFCMKKGNSPKNQDIVDVVSSQLAGGYTWDNFTDAWDVVVRPNEIKVVANIKDIARVTEVCIQASIYAKKGIEFDFDTDEERAIVDMIESHFLEGKMSWDNFRTNWNIRWDNERCRVETYLTNVPTNQTTVTKEMIDAQIVRGQQEANELLTTIKKH